MEKRQTSNFSVAPWYLKGKHIESFSKVTEFNRKQAIVQGRIFYVIEPIGSKWMFRGTLTIDPCFTKGSWRYPFMPWQKNKTTHFKVYFPENLDYNFWWKETKALLDKFIAEGNLYINPADPILTYYKD